MIITAGVMQIGWATKDNTFLNHVSMYIFNVFVCKMRVFLFQIITKNIDLSCTTRSRPLTAKLSMKKGL